MTIGTNDKKKVWLLCILGLVAAYLLYLNFLGRPPAAPRQARPPGAPSPAKRSSLAVAHAPRRRAVAVRVGSNEFHPPLRSKTRDDGVDPDTIDSSLRLNLLAKLRGVERHSGGRDLFQFAALPARKKANRPGPDTTSDPSAPQVQVPDALPAHPGLPAIPLKYYGYIDTASQRPRRAFFLKGDDIYIKAEGELIENRYKVVRIGLKSIVVEDTTGERREMLTLVGESVGS
jgi:hypothetical protein